jgi:glycyl-tRNA synthetase alpha chain
MERIAAFLQDVDSIYDIVWAIEPDTGRKVTYGEIRLAEEEQYSAYSFDYAQVPKLWEHLNLYEAECLALLERWGQIQAVEMNAPPELNSDAQAMFAKQDLETRRFPVLGAYELALKCSHLFNLLDARGAISVTERVGVMARIRVLIIRTAQVYASQAMRLNSSNFYVNGAANEKAR